MWNSEGLPSARRIVRRVALVAGGWPSARRIVRSVALVAAMGQSGQLIRGAMALVTALLIFDVSVGVASPVPFRDSRRDLDSLLVWMTGSFSSASQAAADPSFRDIRLHMTPIWVDLTKASPGTHWLYVEQAEASTPLKPYRQRVYRVTTPNQNRSFRSEVFEIPGPERFVGAWKEPLLFKLLSPESLSVRDGCTVNLARGEGKFYTGGTLGAQCESRLGDAVYATSVVKIAPTRIESWDRGFDAKGQQVWGSTTGPYLFDRIED